MSLGAVVFLSHTGALSGAELAFARLAAALSRRGDAVSVILTETGPLTDVLAEAGVPVAAASTPFASRDVVIGGSLLRLVLGGFRMLAAGWAAGGAVREAGGSVVVAESSKALLMGAVASLRARVPLVWHVHDRISVEYFGRLAPVVRLIGFAAASGFLANSRGTLSTLWTGRRPAAVTYPGVELGRAPRREPQRPAEETRLVMIGRLAEWKGQDLVLEALARTETKASLTFLGGTHFGEEDYAASLAALAERLGLGGRVVFAGHVDDPLAAAAQADVAIHYSRLTEPFGQVVVEALAAGCAVIASEEGGPSEILTDGVDGVLVRPRDPAALAQAIDRLVADPGLRSRLAAAGMDRARDFDMDVVAATAAALVSEVAER